MDWNKEFQEFKTKIIKEGKICYTGDIQSFVNLKEMLDYTYSTRPTSRYVKNGDVAFSYGYRNYRSMSDLFLTYLYYFPKKRSFKVFLDELFNWLEERKYSLFFCNGIEKINIGSFTNFYDENRVFSHYGSNYSNRSQHNLSINKLRAYYKQQKNK